MSRLTQSTSSMLGFIDDIDTSSLSPSAFRIRDNLTNVNDLAMTISHTGLLQPLVVRMKGDDYQIICGHRRYEACKELGWRKISCHIIEASDREAYEISLIENIERKTLDPIEEAKAFKSYTADFGWGGATQLAARIGKSVSYVTKRIALLDLSPQVQHAIRNQVLSASIAEELHPVKDHHTQSQLAQLVTAKKLSMRKVRELVESIHSNLDETIIIYVNNEDKRNRRTQRHLDKSIIALRIALNRLGEVIEEVENDSEWPLKEILMQNKNVLHDQIDLLIKVKLKTPTNFRRLPY